MAYEKLKLVNGETIFTAEHVSHIEDGIIENEKTIAGIEMPCYEKIDVLYSRNPGDEFLDTVTVTANETTENWHKALEEPLTLEEFIGATLTMTDGEITETLAYTEGSELITDYGTYFTAVPFMSVLEETTMDGLTLSPGVWWMPLDTDFDAGSFILSKTVLKQIDDKFIASLDWSKILNRPFYEGVETLFQWTPDQEPVGSLTITDTMTAFKLQEEALTYEQFVGSTVRMETSEGAQSLEYTADNVTNVDTYVIAQPFVSVFEESAVTGITFPPGLWVLGFTAEELSSGTSRLTKPVIKPIDAKFIPEAIKLPEVTTDDNDKFLQVVNGKWTAVAIADADEGGF